MRLTFRGEVVYWRGPAPWYFVAVPEEEAEVITAHATDLTYGWGCIPARATIRDTSFKTSLFPKDGGYLLPVKVAVRRAVDVDVGDVVDVTMDLGA